MSFKTKEVLLPHALAPLLSGENRVTDQSSGSHARVKDLSVRFQSFLREELVGVALPDT